MKTLFILLAALIFAFFLGCESTINGPTEFEHRKFFGATDQNDHAYKDMARSISDIYNLYATIIDESPAGNVNYDIAGTIIYKLSSTDANEGTAGSIVKVKLDIVADVKSNDPGQGIWKVRRTTIESVFVPNVVSAYTVLEVPYEIVNTHGVKIEVTVKYNIYHNSLSGQVVDVTNLSNVEAYTKVF